MSTLNLETFQYDESFKDGSMVGTGSDGCSYRVTGVGASEDASVFYGPHTYVEQTKELQDNETENEVVPFLSGMIEAFAFQVRMHPQDYLTAGAGNLQFLADFTDSGNTCTFTDFNQHTVEIDANGLFVKQFLDLNQPRFRCELFGRHFVFNPYYNRIELVEVSITKLT